MPTPDAAIEGERVVEFSEDGKILKNWYMPVDQIVLGIRGNNILAGLGNSDTALEIGANGSLKYTSTSKPEYKIMSCPNLIKKGYKGSAYVRCFEYRDMISGKKRLLAYQGPCT